MTARPKISAIFRSSESASEDDTPTDSDGDSDYTGDTAVQTRRPRRSMGGRGRRRQPQPQPQQSHPSSTTRGTGGSGDEGSAGEESKRHVRAEDGDAECDAVAYRELLQLGELDTEVCIWRVRRLLRAQFQALLQEGFSATSPLDADKAARLAELVRSRSAARATTHSPSLRRRRSQAAGSIRLEAALQVSSKQHALRLLLHALPRRRAAGKPPAPPPLPAPLTAADAMEAPPEPAPAPELPTLHAVGVLPKHILVSLAAQAADCLTGRAFQWLLEAYCTTGQHQWYLHGELRRAIRWPVALEGGFSSKAELAAFIGGHLLHPSAWPAGLGAREIQQDADVRADRAANLTHKRTAQRSTVIALIGLYDALLALRPLRDALVVRHRHRLYRASWVADAQPDPGLVNALWRSLYGKDSMEQLAAEDILVVSCIEFAEVREDNEEGKHIEVGRRAPLAGRAARRVRDLSIPFWCSTSPSSLRRSGIAFPRGRAPSSSWMVPPATRSSGASRRTQLRRECFPRASRLYPYRSSSSATSASPLRMSDEQQELLIASMYEKGHTTATTTTTTSNSSSRQTHARATVREPVSSRSPLRIG